MTDASYNDNPSSILINYNALCDDIYICDWK